MQSTLQLNTKALPVIAFLAFILQIAYPSKVWVILLTGIGGIWLFCRWWARGLSRSLEFKREMRYGWAQVGDHLEERFTLKNQFGLPATWVEILDHSTLPNHHTSVAVGVDASNTSQWKTVNQCTQRGVFQLGGTTIKTGDPFGVYTVTFNDPTSATLAVMPSIVPLPNFHILSGGWAGEGQVNPHSLEDSISASHTREMVPGDPVRFIHWKTTARRNKFYVRQSDSIQTGDRWLLLDLDKKSQAGSDFASTEEHEVILAASLIVQSLNEGYPIGLAVNGKEPAWHVPNRNEYQQQSLLKSLAVAAPSEIDLKDFLKRTNKTFGGRCSLLIVTACADIEWIQSLIPLMRRGILPTVFLFDANTYGGTANIQEISSTLQLLGISCNVIPRDFLDKPQARPGHEGIWEWRILANGKAIAVHKPVTDWRGLK